MNVRKIKNFIKIIFGIPKSLVFNVTKFGLIEGIKLPIIVSNNTILKDISGEIILKNPKTFGVRIGFGSTDNYSWKHEKTIFKNRGQLVFEGKAKLGFGSVISNSGYLNIGNNFSISCKGSIICRKKIVIGNDCLMSWDTLIMDTDHHPIFFEKQRINEDQEIVIGNKNWIGAKSTILKGVEIGDNNVISLGAILTKSFLVSNKVIAGIPAKIVKDNVQWS